MGEERRHDGYFDFSGIDSHYLVDDAYDNTRIQHQRMGVPASVAPPNAARYTDGVAIIDDIESFRNRSGIRGTVVTNAYDISVAPPNAARYTYDGVAIIDDISTFRNRSGIRGTVVTNAYDISVAPPNAARYTYDGVARNTSGIMFPHSPPFNHPTLPMQGMRGHSVYFHPPAPSYSLPSCGTDHRGVMHQATLAHRNLPPMGFIQLDDVALLPDHHADLRLDIEDMSYEELLALGERIGNVSTRLSDEMVTTQMKTKTYSISATASEEHETDICIICQDEYKNHDMIGILQCGHEYHADCLRKWLLVKNVCPICKSEALIPGGR